MIGNDVIDLAQTRKESNWQRKGFMEKIFTAEEQLFIKNYTEPEIAVWLLWSMKEAAYKIYNRKTKIRTYIPKKLCCSIITSDKFEVQGFVICNDNKYYTKTLITAENIHTTAVANVQNLNNTIEIERKGIVKDESGIPYLAVSSDKAFKDISISHHGRFERIVMIADNQ